MTGNLRLDMSGAPASIRDYGPQLGDVYRNQRGRLMAIVSIQRGQAHLLHFDDRGEVDGTTSYGVHYLAEKRRIGRLIEMPTLAVDWTAADQEDAP